MTMLSDDEFRAAIVQYITINPGCSGSSIARAMRVANPTLHPHLSALQDLGAIAKKGKTNATQWYAAGDGEEWINLLAEFLRTATVNLGTFQLHEIMGRMPEKIRAGAGEGSDGYVRLVNQVEIALTRDGWRRVKVRVGMNATAHAWTRDSMGAGRPTNRDMVHKSVIAAIVLLLLPLASPARAESTAMPIRAGIVQCGPRAQLAEACKADDRCCAAYERLVLGTPACTKWAAAGNKAVCIAYQEKEG